MKRAILVTAALAAMATAAQAQNFGRFDSMGSLETADSNGDGTITRQEYAASRDARFASLDRNHDGAISKSDFGRLAKFRPEAANRLNALIRQVDQNQDGKATKAEFSSAPMPLFDRADSNADGKLDQGELAALRSAAAAMRDGKTQ